MRKLICNILQYIEQFDRVEIWQFLTAQYTIIVTYERRHFLFHSHIFSYPWQLCTIEISSSTYIVLFKFPCSVMGISRKFVKSASTLALSKLTGLNFHFNEMPRWLACALKFQEHYAANPLKLECVHLSPHWVIKSIQVETQVSVPSQNWIQGTLKMEDTALR